MREFREQICEAKRHELQTAEDRLPLARLKVWAEAIEPARGFAELLAQKGERPVVVADVSPAERWQGGVACDFVPSEWARSLLAHQDVRALALPSAASTARGEVTPELDEFSGWLEPRLVRDFVIDEYQIYALRAAGADSFDLHPWLLDLAGLQYCIEVARDLGMEPVIWLETQDDWLLAQQTDARILGLVPTAENFSALPTMAEAVRRWASEPVGLIWDLGDVATWPAGTPSIGRAKCDALIVSAQSVGISDPINSLNALMSQILFGGKRHD